MNTRYTWRARAEGIDVFGPWSTTASFLAPESAFLGVSTFADPLTNGRTVGQRRGGHFVAGQGWMSDSTTDGIDYDLQVPCTACALEFDVTNFGRAEGRAACEGFEVDLDGRWRQRSATSARSATIPGRCTSNSVRTATAPA